MTELLLGEREGVNQQRNGEGCSRPRVSMSKGRELRDHAEPPGRVIFQAHEGPGRWGETSGASGRPPSSRYHRGGGQFSLPQMRPHARHPKSKSDCAITWFESSLGAPSLIR